MEEKKASKKGNAAGHDATIAGLVKAVERSAEFREWRKGNKTAFLSSAFTMAGSVEEACSPSQEWLLSYYDLQDDTFTTFGSAGSQKAAREEAFKKGRELPELKTGDVAISIAASIKRAEAVRTGDYRGEVPSRLVVILQPLADEEIFAAATGSGKGKRAAAKPAARPVWNITYITSAFNVINIKIDAATGDVLAHSLSGIMDFVQKDK